ncbi:MAG TPA: class I SAM-dependent methyltransferase [Nitratidesulfovibrio sp.]|nr:class I SAM-dependent methyltransferase [Nitratidesulfovibrio sp.]
MKYHDDADEASQACGSGNFLRKLDEYYAHYYRDALGLPDWQERCRLRRDEVDVIGEKVLRPLESVHNIQLSGARCLVVGCGSGAELGALLRRSSEVYGVEPDVDGVELSRMRAVQGGQAFDVAATRIVQGVSEHLPWEDAFFDVVICHTVLEHVSDIRRSVQEMIRVCRKGGRVFFHLPDYRFPWEGHYKMWLPTFLPRQMLNVYLELKGRPSDFLRTINFATAPQLDRIFAEIGVAYSRFVPHSAMPKQRLLAWYCWLLNLTPHQYIVLYP